MAPFEVEPGSVSVTIIIILHDGTRITIEPGKQKTVFVRSDNRFHLLDCQCALCAAARKDGAA